ncbi:MAG: hypothetical protein U1C55_06755 [Smithellaceae bacterium]|nr:hypothetical protein [Smithellaceae bacterium]
MFKSITAKAILPVALAVTGFVSVSCILLYVAIKQDMIQSAVQYETNLAQMVVKSTRQTMLKDDRQTLANIISNIGQTSGIEHVRIFNKKGIIMFSREGTEINRSVDTKASGCIECHTGDEPAHILGKMEQARRFINDRGQEILAITAPIYNEPDCFTAACHFHRPDQKILGTLDIGLDQAPLQQGLKALLNRMVMFGILLLLLTITGITALLKLNIFDPINRLSSYTGGLLAGEKDLPFPTIKGDLRQLARNIQQLTRATASSRGTLGPSSEHAPLGSPSIDKGEEV